MRFISGEKNRRCDTCGFLFSDADITMDDDMSDVWSRKGFRCSSCGTHVCLSCMPTGDDAESTYFCSCGGSLAIRI